MTIDLNDFIDYIEKQGWHPSNGILDVMCYRENNGNTEWTVFKFRIVWGKDCVELQPKNEIDE